MALKVKLHPQTAYEKVTAVWMALNKIIVQNKNDGASDDDLSYYTGMATMLESSLEELKDIELFLDHYRVNKKILDHLTKINLAQEAEISILKARNEQLANGKQN